MLNIHVPKYLSCFLLILITFFYMTCTNYSIAGSGTEEGNVVTGSVVDTNAIPSPDAVVMLIPSDFNPVTQGKVPDSLIDTTDASGRYVFTINDSGKYNIEVKHIYNKTMTLLTDVTLDTDTTLIPGVVLKEPGSIRVYLPDSLSGTQKVAYIKGTSFVRFIATTAGDDPSILIDSLPEGYLPSLYVSDENNSFLQTRLADSIRIISNDTGEIDAFTFWKLYFPGESVNPPPLVTDMAITPDGTKWFVLFDRGLVTYDGLNWSEYNDFNTPLPSGSPRKMAVQDDGTLWIALYKGLASYKQDAWTVYTKENSPLPSDLVFNVTCDQSNSIWIGTQDSGALQYNGSEWKRYDTLTSPIVSNQINSLFADNQNAIWIATPKGASFFNGASWTTIDQTNSLLYSDYIHKIFIDSKGTIWFTHEGGVSFLQESSWGRFTRTDCPLLENVVWNMTQDREGIYWFLTNKGMASFDGTDWKVYSGKRYPLLDGKEIYAITEDTNGHRWVCTGSGGIVVFGSINK